MFRFHRRPGRAVQLQEGETADGRVMEAGPVLEIDACHLLQLVYHSISELPCAVGILSPRLARGSLEGRGSLHGRA